MGKGQSTRRELNTSASARDVRRVTSSQPGVLSKGDQETKSGRAGSGQSTRRELNTSAEEGDVRPVTSSPTGPAILSKGDQETESGRAGLSLEMGNEQRGTRRELNTSGGAGDVRSVTSHQTRPGRDVNFTDTRDRPPTRVIPRVKTVPPSQMTPQEREKWDKIHAQRNELSTAAAEGDVHRVSSILERTGIDGNFTDPSFIYPSIRPPLLAACKAGQLEVVRVLLKNKDIRVNFVYEEETPLSATAESGYTEIMKLLLEHGAGVDYVGDDPGDDVWTALMVAADNGQYEAAVLLLQNGAKVEGTQSQYRRDTPLSLAAGNGYANLVQLLLDNGASVPGHGFPPPLLAACRVGQLELVRVLLEHKDIRVNFVYLDETPLSTAAKKGYTEVMKLLLEHGTGVDYVGDDHGVWTALIVAAYNGQYEAAVLLLQHVAKVEGIQSRIRWDTPLSLAAGNGHATLVQLLLDNGASVQGGGGPYSVPPLTAARLGDHTECARILIQHGAPVNEESRYGTPLTCAAGNGHTECTRLLLENEADVNKSKADNRNRTPLMLASKRGHIDDVKLLLNHGADVNLSSSDGETVLSLARSKNHVEIAELLLKHGAKEEGSELDSEGSSTEESVEDRKEEREDDHVEDREKEADAEDLGDPSEAEHLAAVDRAMNEKGTLEHTLAHGVLVGPARSGKSSLMTRLVGEMPSPTSPSTGVAEQAIHVGVRKSYSIALGVLDSIWFKLLFDEEAIRLMTLAFHFPLNNQLAHSLTVHHHLLPLCCKVTQRMSYLL